MHPRRLIRLNELILQTVSQAVLNLKDPHVGFVTITGADLAPDLSNVKVFYSVLGSPYEKNITVEALERAKPHIRHEVGKLENLRKVPRVEFVYDESVERADRVTRLLSTIQIDKTPEDPNDGNH